MSDLHYIAGMVVKKLGKSGHSLVVAIPKIMIDRLWLTAGDYIKLEDVVEGILLRPLMPRAGARNDAGLPRAERVSETKAKVKK